MLRVVLLLVASVALYSGLGSSVASAEQKVQLMANTSPPYADRKLPEQGLALELVKHIFSRTDYQPEITIESWARALEGARLGIYDGLASVWHTEDRSKDLLYSEPYLGSRLIILKLRSNGRNPRQLQDLSGARLGVRVDYAYGIDLQAIPRLRLVEENHLIQNLLNLLNGSVDYVIGDQRTIAFQLHEFLKNQINSFEVVGIELPGRERHVAASRSVPGHEQLITAFDRALVASRKDGSLEAIIKKWDKRYSGFD